MTTPEERTRAVLKTRVFLKTLLNSAWPPDVPEAVRQRGNAASLLPRSWGNEDCVQRLPALVWAADYLDRLPHQDTNNK